MSKSSSNLPALPGGRSVATEGDVAAFFGKVPAKSGGREKAIATTIPQAASSKPRIIFSLDATASRAPTWQRAQRVQGEMFEAMSGRGEVQLVSYSGAGVLSSRWATDSRELADDMARVHCVAGNTQIRALLRHYRQEAKGGRVVAVFIGDTVEEDSQDLIDEARKCKLLGVPVFVFHEVGNPSAEPTLRAIAQESGGAYVRFADGDPKKDLQPLLGAVAAYAEGGRRALLKYGEQSKSEAVKALGYQLKIEGPKQ
jgi:hypothetical protein